MKQYIKLRKIRKLIQNKLNLNRQFTRTEKKYIKIWVKTYKYNIDIILLAFHYTLNKDNPNFAYIHCLLSDWYKRNLLTKAEVIKWIDYKKSKVRS